MSIAPNRPSSIRTALTCRCPACGQGKLFKGYLRLADKCSSCGQDFGFADPADGPAFFVMSGIGILVIAVWAWWVVVQHPPIWAQMTTIFPAFLGGSLISLRPVKAWLVAEQFLHKAEEAKWASTGVHGIGEFALDRRKSSNQGPTLDA